MTKNSGEIDECLIKFEKALFQSQALPDDLNKLMRFGTLCELAHLEVLETEVIN